MVTKQQDIRTLSVKHSRLEILEYKYYETKSACEHMGCWKSNIHLTDNV